MKQIYSPKFYTIQFYELAWGLRYYGFAVNPRRAKFRRSKKQAYPLGAWKGQRHE